MVNTVRLEGRPLRLTSDRLLLRDLQSGDWPAVYALRGDPAVAQAMGLEPDGEAESRAWLERATHHNRLLPRQTYNLAIVLQESGDVAGWIGMYRLVSGEDAHYELSFALIRRFWGKGYMTEALRTLLPFAFDALNARRLVADCLPHNVASASVLQKVGMCYEGPVSSGDSAGDPVDGCLRYALDAQAWRHRDSAN